MYPTVPTIVVLNNGPLLINEPVNLVDHEGVAIQATKFPIALCRCGLSQHKPLCDGAHKPAGFDGTCVRQAP